ncbi:NACHT domain-containing protein [Streptomyces chrestomyceticus]|uniref:NACHT domain-containing protein n=1 Tax=Streptomyces chrestomyceticus TaxID=68185 RepID=UPI003788FB8B
MRKQYARDQIVKFKQAELKPELLDVFVDVPLVSQDVYKHQDLVLYSRGIDLGSMASGALEKWEGLLTDRTKDIVVRSRHDIGIPGASFLLSQATVEDAGEDLLRHVNIVLEGAPGQGKSTVAQYVCQVQRARILGLDAEISKFRSEHMSTPIRLPFHVDLRDLSTWLRREDPFDVKNVGEPARWSNSLEAYLAAQVTNDSGGMDFSVADLDSATSATPTLLMLDGLDEVPDLSDRRAVVTAVNEAVNRMSFSCPSLLTIVTSRPSAFAKTPGFSRKDFNYLVLADLPLGLVLQYTDGWLRSRNIPHKEAYDVRRVLGEKLGQTHILDLARNPMQLAILLWLVNRKGLSLPDKRTALYGAYMDTFLDREAEKSTIVRDERDLILELHGHVAWELHCQAELGNSRGSITETKLKALLRKYMNREGYKADLVDQLFTGMTQRVMVLTARVQGAFEFEVQPLREYFAARYLYSTARVSPPGAERTGTRSDRFEALLRNPYWWNVTRFYAGFSDKGELANVVDLLEVLYEDGDFSLIAYPREVSATLLRDQVFSQRPRSASKLLEMVTSERSLALLHATASGDFEQLALSEEDDSLTERLRCRVEKGIASGRVDPASCRALRVNEDPSELCDWWFKGWRSANSDLQRRQWIATGYLLGTLSTSSIDQLASVADTMRSDSTFWHYLAQTAQTWLPDSDSPGFLGMQRFLREAVPMCDVFAFRYGSVLELAQYATSPNFIRVLNSGHSGHVVNVFSQAARSAIARNAGEEFLLRIVSAVSRLAEDSNRHGNLGLWHDVHAELVNALGGESKRSLIVALFAGRVRSGNVSRQKGGRLLDNKLSACYRARYARQRGKDDAWWAEQVNAIRSVQDAWFVLGAMLLWGAKDCIARNARSLDVWAERFSYDEVLGLMVLVSSRPSFMRPQDRNLGPRSPLRGISHQLQAINALTCTAVEALDAFDVAIRKASRDSAFRALYAERKVSCFFLLGGDSIAGRVDDLRRAEKLARRKPYAPNFSRYRELRVSTEVARDMLADPTSMHAFVTSQADSRLMRDISGSAEALADVAERDGWFAEE